MVWAQVDRRTHGFSSAIGDALCAAYNNPASDNPASKTQNRAIQVIKRAVESGARIDEDFPIHVPQYCMALPTRQEPSDADREWRVYTTTRNHLLLGLYTKDEAIIEVLLREGLPASLSIDFYVVDCSTTMAKPPDRPGRLGPFGPPLPEPSMDLSQADEFCPPWVWYDYLNVEGCYVTITIADLLEATEPTEAVLPPMRQLLDPTIQLLKQFSVVGKSAQDLTGIKKPHFPLNTLTILRCSVCGNGYVIGWFDWVVENGRLVGGTKPRQWWCEEDASCKVCSVAESKHELSKLVHDWIGDIPVMTRPDPSAEGFASLEPLSWYEKHFKFFSLRSSGLEPTTTENFEVDSFDQWYEVSRRKYCFSLD
jgi:hypothetical protein